MRTQKNHVWEYSNHSTRKSVVRFIFTWLATIVIFVILFSQIEFIDVLVLLKQTDIKFLSAGVLCSLLAHLFLSSARFQNVVKMMGCRISFGEAVTVRMGCNPIKGILPFKMGEFAILAYMKRKYDLSYARGLLGILSGYAFSLIALLFFCLTGGIIYFQHPFQKMILIGIFLLILLLVTTSIRQRIPGFIASYIHKIRRLPEDEKKIIENYDPRISKNIMIQSLGIEGCKLLIISFLFKSLSIELPIDALLLWGGITIIAAYLPLTYWGLGVREATVLFLFAGYATPDKLLAGGLLITFVDSLLPVLLGLFFVKPFLDNLLGSKKAETGIISGDG